MSGQEVEKKIFCPGFEQFFDRNTTTGAWKAKLIRVHIAASDGLVGTYEYRPNQANMAAAQSLTLLFTDHLGSVDLAINIAGSTFLNYAVSSTRTKYSYDPWGERRNEATWSGAHVLTTAELAAQHTDCGFTGHEMLDELGLINMNARIYDPQLGRFLSADSIVQSAGDLQSYNRYSYCGNNPLSRIDPSGHSWLSSAFKGVGDFVSKYWKAIVAVVLAVVTAGMFMALYFSVGFTTGLSLALTGSAVSCAGVGCAFTVYAASCSAMMMAGAVGGFVSSFSISLMSGHSLGQALQDGVKGAAVAAITAGVMYNTDTYLPDWTKGKIPGKDEKWFTQERIVRQFERISARATVNGASSEIMGGSFKDGFTSAALWDSIKCTTEVLMEWRYRWKCKNNRITTKEFDDKLVRDQCNSWSTSNGVATDKELNYESIVNPHNQNVGIPKNVDMPPWVAFVVREDGWCMRHLSQYISGMNNLGLLHDYWASSATIHIGGTFFGVLNRTISAGSIPPFMAFDYAILVLTTMTDYGIHTQ